MERIRQVPAKVVDGVVQIKMGEEFFPASDVLLNSQGLADSEGFVLIGQESTRYITNTQVDAAFMLQKVIEVVNNLISVCESSGYAIPTSGTAQIPGLVSIGSELRSINQELQEYKLR